jgi:hypothetical protein
MNKLHDIHGGSRWCGPAALTALTGRPTDEMAAEIRKVTGRKMITYVYASELQETLESLGYTTRLEYITGEKPTLARWLREREDRNAFTIVLVTRHFVTVKGVKLVDNRVKKPVFIRKAPGRRKRVLGVITVTGRTAP